jgi:hypothetical protein
MVNDLVTVLVVIVGWMILVDISHRPGGRERVMDDEET